jgi:hypothetical protein
MDAEHLYQWLIYFFKTSSKTSWGKNELVDVIKDQYIELMKKLDSRHLKNNTLIVHHASHVQR